MILACPSCATRFQIEEAELRRPGGRLLRCGSCRHEWRHELPAPEPLLPEPELPASDPLLAAPAVFAPERPAPPPPQPRSGSWAAAAVVLAVLVIGIGLLVGVADRQQIAAMSPTASRFYATIGLPTGPPAAEPAVDQPAPPPTPAALKIVHIAASRTQHGLIIEGDIQNNGSTTSDVPRLRISLQDRNSRELQSEIVPAPEPQVSAGAHIHFSAPFQNPDKAATDVEVTFVSRTRESGAPRTDSPPFPRASKS